MFDFRPFFVLRLALKNRVDHAFYEVPSSSKPGLEIKGQTQKS